ncbi:hypothetical protein MHU86_8549 [Fragilaria crotonensis]|nr:hypothetical protein MHU86_8549 [Fragilaria crotonensis]
MTTAPLRTAHHGFGPSDVSGSVNGDSKVGGVGGKGMDKKNHKKIHPIDKKRASEKAQALPGKVDGLLGPRACVKLPYGVGFFSLGSLSCEDDVSSFSDAMLVSRWKGMVDTALSVAGCIDLAAMANFGVGAISAIPSKESKADNADDAGSNESTKDVREGPHQSQGNCVSVPAFGSNMLPTSAGRAVRMADIPIVSLELGLNSSLYDNGAILGKIENKGVPAKFREWEDIRDELSLLRAQVLQRRNELARQRRLRVMNERALATTTDKASRVENLVAEMRADLKSLKDRLDYELIELGIDGEQAGSLLSAHYNDADCKSDFDSSCAEMDNSPPHQRKRRELDRQLPSTPSRRRLDGTLTDDDVDDTRPSAKRTRPSQ